MRLRVHWVIDEETDDKELTPAVAREAAERALGHILRPGSQAHVFTVARADDKGRPLGPWVKVDLNEASDDAG